MNPDGPTAPHRPGTLRTGNASGFYGERFDAEEAARTGLATLAATGVPAAGPGPSPTAFLERREPPWAR